MGVTDIRKVLNHEFSSIRPDISRETVYRLVAEARRRRFIRLVPPLADELGRQLSGMFELPVDAIKVVNTTRADQNERVAIAAAEIAWQKIQDISLTFPRIQVKGDVRLQRPVCIGLGPGRATLEFSKHLSLLLESAANLPDLSLVSITAGCPARFPEYAPVSFFNLFPRRVVASQIGLFAETIVPARELPVIAKRPGAREAFEVKRDIDIVVTSMVDFEDEIEQIKFEKNHSYFLI